MSPSALLLIGRFGCNFTAQSLELKSEKKRFPLYGCVPKALGVFCQSILRKLVIQVLSVE